MYKINSTRKKRWIDVDMVLLERCMISGYIPKRNTWLGCLFPWLGQMQIRLCVRAFWSKTSLFIMWPSRYITSKHRPTNDLIPRRWINVDTTFFQRWKMTGLAWLIRTVTIYQTALICVFAGTIWQISKASPDTFHSCKNLTLPKVQPLPQWIKLQVSAETEAEPAVVILHNIKFIQKNKKKNKCT